ncbi:MAG: hypothetical protein NHF92_00170 [Candidatus Shikimatogenerans bostrichidophilus]|nr:MAG: hypothetical protein NHF92_00170 [Candidatus Shikimatogenerans bostrichidophilus]
MNFLLKKSNKSYSLFLKHNKYTFILNRNNINKIKIKEYFYKKYKIKIRKINRLKYKNNIKLIIEFNKKNNLFLNYEKDKDKI